MAGEDALPNPFADDVCPGPFAVEENRSVPGMNADVLNQLTATIDERSGARGGQPLLLLTAPRAGYGKTHLLGRLASAAGGQVVLVPLAFRLEDDISLASVSKRGLEAMARAENGRAGWTRLREACAGVCAALLRELIASGRLPCANADQAKRVLGSNPVEIFDPAGAARLIGDWIRRHGASLRKPLTEQAARSIPAPMPVLEAWMNALMSHAQEGTAASSVPVRALAADEDSEGPPNFLRVLGLWRPVVILVDHLDAYYRNPEAGLKIASLLLDMAEMDGVHVVLSLNQDVWQATFGHHLPSAMEDRLTASQMLLRGIGMAEAAELLRMRLDIADVTPEQAREFEAFVDVPRHFLGRPLGSVSARGFLRHLARQWEVFQNTAPSPGQGFAGGIIEERPEDMVSTTVAVPAGTPGGEETMQPMPAMPVESDPHQIFDATTTQRAKNIAEGLAEPVAALPQENEPDLPMPPAEMAAAPRAADAGFNPNPELSARAASAFERLREMLGKLRQPAVSPEPEGEPGHASNGSMTKLEEVMSSAVPVAAATATAPAVSPAVVPATTPLAAGTHPAPVLATPVPSAAHPAATEDARDTLLGRYEALRLQMSAEAETLPLDHAKLVELIRLAGRRFPLVRLSEHELPGLTGHHVMCWSLQGLEILFGMGGFADSAYWRTLSSFAAGRQAQTAAGAEALGETPPKVKLVIFKTDREQQSWSILRMSDAFPAVVEPMLDAVHLDPASVTALYAMQRIIKEAESGALQATPAQVMSVLARELDFFWKRVTRA